MDELSGPGNRITPHKIEPPQQTFFFERHDGSIISVAEREAWELLKKRQMIVGKHYAPHRLIGVSSGEKFHQAIVESHQMHKDMKTAEEILARIKLGEAEELEAARGNMVMPRNFDMVDSRGNPTIIKM